MATAPGVTKANYASLPGGTRTVGASSPTTRTGLTNGVTYYVVVTAVDAGGESTESAEVSATPAAAGSTNPVTGDATAVTDASAQLAGVFTNPAGFVTTAWFEYGPTSALGSATAPSTYAASGAIQLSATLTGLAASTTYYYRLTTQNSDGTFAGGAKTFSTLATPQELASNLDAPNGLLLEGSELYWVEVYGGVVRKVSTDGGSVSVVGTSPTGANPAWLALDATNAYWADTRTIWKIPLAGGSVTTLVTGREIVGPLVAYASELYWREAKDSVGAAVAAILKMNTAGGTVDTLLRWLTPDGVLSFGPLVVDASGIYWTDQGTINWRAVGGGPTVVLAVNVSPNNLIHEGGTLYWTSGNSVMKMPDTGGAITTIVGTGPGAVGLAKDATHVYWADGDTQLGSYTIRQIRKADLSSGTVTTLAMEQRGASYLVVDGTSVYWLVGGDRFNINPPPLGAVRKVPK